MFELRIGWTDTSYWDEGSRATTTTLKFDTLDAVNLFLEKHLNRPYTFMGQEADVQDNIDPERLHLMEIQKIEHDVYSLPALGSAAFELIRAKLKDILKWGGDLKGIEARAIKIGWSRELFLRIWQEIVKEAADRGG